MFMEYGRFYSRGTYDLQSPAFQAAYTFLARTDLAELPVGRIALGYGAYASIQHYDSMPAETLAFETHEKYFDIQYVAAGEEYIGVTAREGLTEKIPYDESSDITFYHDPSAYGRVYLRQGDYVILAPEDAHKPRCCVSTPAPVIKVVVKVPV